MTEYFLGKKDNERISRMSASRSILKNSKGVLLLVSLLICVVTAAQSEITGSAHDFSFTGPGTYGNWSGDRKCITCHTPHNADLSVTDSPLWNHDVTGAGPFTLYDSSPTLHVDTTASITQPNGISKLCLSCHDGTVALDAFGGGAGGTFMSGNKQIGAGLDLKDDHPISFDWKHQSVKNLVNCPGCHAQPGWGNLPLPGGKIECSTCHDVHNRHPANIKLLRVTISGSQLCLLCHDK
jgi:predicted CXXCH cytochrome family protein